MELQDDILTIFTAKVHRRNGSPVIDVPDRELELGTIRDSATYRVAILETGKSDEPSNERRQSTQSSEPPVTQGDRIEVEIEDKGEQGDGIARVGPGYIIFVESADIGDRVTVEIQKVLDNYAFAQVVEPEPILG